MVIGKPQNSYTFCWLAMHIFGISHIFLVIITHVYGKQIFLRGVS